MGALVSIPSTLHSVWAANVIIHGASPPFKAADIAADLKKPVDMPIREKL